jgi:hypothetical protein
MELMKGVGARGQKPTTLEEVIDAQRKVFEKSDELNRTLNAKYESQLKNLLSPQQFTRLQQIKWQHQGAESIADPDLARQLMLSEEQQEKIRQIMIDHQGKLGELIGRRGNLQESIQQRDRLLDEVLSVEQRAKLTQLKGKPFDLNQLGLSLPKGAAPKAK